MSQRRLKKFKDDLRQVLKKWPELVILEGDSEDEESILKIVSDDLVKYTISIVEYPGMITIFDNIAESLETTSGTLVEIVERLLGDSVSSDEDDDPEMVQLDDEEYYHQNFGATEEPSWTRMEQLRRDVEVISQELGEDSIYVITDDVSNEFTVVIKFNPLDVVNLVTAEAWNISCEHPIQIHLTYQDGIYHRQYHECRMEIFQDSKKKQNGIRFQLETIMREFMNHIKERKIEHHPKDNRDPVFQELMWMGFTERKIKQAMKKYDNVDQAVGWLLENPDSEPDEPEPDEPEPEPEEEEEEKEVKKRSKHRHKKRLSLKKKSDDEKTERKKSRKKEGKKETKKVAKEAKKEKKESSGLLKLVSDLLWGETEDEDEDEEKPKGQPSDVQPDMCASSKHDGMGAEVELKGKVMTRHGFLYCFMYYMFSRMSNLNRYCVICDQPHVFGMNNMLKPTVCARPLCCFSYQQMGVAKDLVDYISTSAEVVDLLVTMAKLAAQSNRAKDILEPYPLVMDPTDSSKTVLDPNGKNFARVLELFNSFPEMEIMATTTDISALKSLMEAQRQHSYNLLQWVITSNRSHIVKLHADTQLPSMRTSHQYLMLSQPPEKEAQFAQLKAKHGSVFAFHGSRAENWHSIMRLGLKNASGTKLQLNGAAYGNGIYLSPDSSTSLGYSSNSSTSRSGSQAQVPINDRFLSSQNVLCIAICEVIDNGIKKSGSVWVMPHPERVCTRFLFVYDSRNNMMNVNCNTSTINNEIVNAMNFYQLG